MPNLKTNTPGVQIGNVHGDIVGSQFAGRDIIRSTATASGRSEEAPSFEQVKQLVETILLEIRDLSSCGSSLSDISAASPARVQGAMASVNASLAKLAPNAPDTDKKSVMREIADAESSISHLIENAKEVVANTAYLGAAAGPLLDLLSPLHAHLTQAVDWIGRLWS